MRPSLRTTASASRMLRATLLGTVLGALLTTSAAAHVTSKSFSFLSVAGTAVEYRLEASPVDLALAAGLIEAAEEPVSAETLLTALPRITRYVSPRIALIADGQACNAGPWSIAIDGLPSTVTLSSTFECLRPVGSLLLQYLLFFELDAHHASVGRLEGDAGQVEFVVTELEPEFEWSRSAAASGTNHPLGRFFLFGVQHILIGYDHLLFLLGLIVTSLRWRNLLGVVTVFTGAHTVTLLLAALGYVTVPSRIVEPIIALSIAYVAVENLLGRSLRWRWAVVFAFGLVHGLGFAAVLSELARESALSIWALLLFNVGVEAGQLLAVGAALPVLSLAVRAVTAHGLRQAVSLGILAVAVYWFAERVFLS